MKTFFTKFLPLLIFCGIISITSFAQIDLNKLKNKAVDKGKEMTDNKNKKVPPVKKESTVTNPKTECDYTERSGGTPSLIKLQDILKACDAYLEAGEYHMTETKFLYIETYIADIKTNCPQFEIAPYEERYATIKRDVATGKAEADKEAEAAASEEEMSDKATLLLSYITDYRLHLSNTPVADAQRFYDKCKETDYLNFKKSFDAAMAKNPDFKAQAEEPYGASTRLNKDYEEFIASANEAYIPEINRAIEEGYSQKAAKNMDVARQKAQAAVICADALLLIAPDNVDFQAIQKDAKALFSTMNKELALTVYTSEFHGENVEKFVFSKKPIVLKSENPANMTSAFAAGDYIYGMAYLSDKINALAFNSDVRLFIYVDGANKYNRRISLRYKKDFTAIDFEIVPDPATSEQQGGVDYSRELSTLSPRNHKIKIELRDDGGAKILAVGEFTLDCSQGMDKLTQIAQDLKAKQLSKVRMPAGGALNTPALQQQAMKIWTGDETPLRVVVTDNDWTVRRNAISGAIEYREAWTAIAVKRTDGTCVVFDMALRQDYTGSGYGATKFGAIGDNQEIACENVNK
ncbi:MAG TPA: hypothetical protein PLW77_06970 [Bacteroidales bacterium]|nr:hypothetical protein [Bacteroidales bacterium]HQB21053.1 hypothetical protein [Bacteroidales bacterium]